MGLTREEFIKTHGYDPEGEGVQIVDVPTTSKQKQLPGVVDAARNLAVGAITAIPDVIALPGVIAAAGSAAYDAATSDQKFLPSLAKRMQVDGAEDKIKAHLSEREQEWLAQDPTITAQDMQRLRKEYSESKPFEEFTQSMLRGGVRHAAQFKDAVRETLGDDRSDKQRSWMDSALEIIGSSVVGIGPSTAAKLAHGASKNAVARAIVNNPVGYGAARTAEVLTPLTLPLTPGNVALNAGVGIGIDQGMRYATGQSSIISEDDAKLGGLATVAAVTGVAAAVVAAARGRASNVAQNATIPPVPKDVADAMSSGVEPGGAALNAGRALADAANTVQPALFNSGSIVKDTRDFARVARDKVVDETTVARALIRDLHGEEAARQFEISFSNDAGAGGYDTAQAAALNTMRPVLREFDKFDEEQKAVLRSDLIASNVIERREITAKYYDDAIGELKAKETKGTLTTEQAKELAELQATRTRFLADEPDTRRYVPEISTASLQERADVFRTNPAYEGFRNAWRKAMDDIADASVKGGRLGQEDATKMRTAMRDYTPLQQNTLEDATGIKAVAKRLVRDLRKEPVQGGSANKSALDSFDPKVPELGAARVSRPVDPIFAMETYLRNMYIDIQHNSVKRELVHSLEYAKDGSPSKYVTDGNMRRVEVNGRTEFSSAELRGNPALRDAADNDKYVRVYVNGKVRFYEFADPEVTRLMRFAPDSFHGVALWFKSAADLFKANTTGVFSPAFAPVNALYDTTMSLATRRPDRAFGPIDALLRRVLNESVSKHVLGRVPDVTAYAALPYHIVAGIGERMAVASARYIAASLTRDSIIGSIANAMGRKNFETLVEGMLRTVEKSKTQIMMDKGIMYSSAMGDINRAMDAYKYASQAVPGWMRASYTFYKDIISSIHAAPKRMYYAQNYSLLKQKYGDNIPKREMDALIYETRSLAGDMTRQAGTDWMRKLEAATPYMAPMRNGVTHLARSMFTPSLASYTWPRLMVMMGGVMSSFYMMSNWNEEARKEFWINTPEWMRYRYLFLPTPELLAAFSRGESPEYHADLIYKLPLGPDLAPLIAGTSAFMRGIGALPNNPYDTAATASDDLLKMTKDMFLPVAPPLITTMIAAAGGRVDLNAIGDTGGRVLSGLSFNQFRKGPQDEVTSPLGSMNNTTQQVLATLFGTNGMYVARSYDAFVHASRFDQRNTPAGEAAKLRDTENYIEGLKAATTTFMQQTAKRLPDVPNPLWKQDEKQYVLNTGNSAVREYKEHIQSIVGMRDFSRGPRSVDKRRLQGAAGEGVVPQTMDDDMLLRVADDIRTWNTNRSSPFVELKKEYSDLAATRRAIESNYTLDRARRSKRVNELIDQMQENMNQQRLAIMYKEQELNERYGPMLRPRLGDQPVTMKALDQVMRQVVERR